MKKIKHDWQAILEDWTESKLDIKTYCNLKNLPRASFYEHKKRLKIFRSSKCIAVKDKDDAVEFVDMTPAEKSPYLVNIRSSDHEPTIRVTTASGSKWEFYL